MKIFGVLESELVFGFLVVGKSLVTMMENLGEVFAFGESRS